MLFNGNVKFHNIIIYFILKKFGEISADTSFMRVFFFLRSFIHESVEQHSHAKSGLNDLNPKMSQHPLLKCIFF